VGDNPNLTWARTLIGALARGGVGHVCVSPGSRSSPLALAVAERADLTVTIHIDERSAGFFALGYARASGRPAALVCTSGTAGANYLPAIIEAHYSRVPLVVLTADRPPEMRDSGAWQTIDQVGLFGGYARWFADLLPPDPRPDLLRYARVTAARAVAVARGRPAGPVHLNVPFREPLAPEPARDRSDGGWDDGAREIEPSPAADGDGSPGLAAPPAPAGVAAETLDDLAARMAAEPRGLILAGLIDPPPGYAAAIAGLAAAAGYPILAEPAGGLRFGPHDRSHVIAGYDAFLRAPRWSDAHAPGLVLRFGASLTWKVVAGFLERHPRAYQAVVDPDHTWDDPTRLAALRLHADPVPLCESLVARLAGVGGGESGAARRAWLAEWRAAASVTSKARAEIVSQSVDGGRFDHVGWVYETLLESLAEGGVVYAANSMAVRDLDTFAPPVAKALRVIANRGAAGIDGTVSSALGAALGSGRPAILTTGDLAFLHDLNGLGAVARDGARAADMGDVDLTIVVLNDDGGGIFAHLPIAGRDAATFTRFFRTPTGADLAAACATYGVPYRRATSPRELAAALEARPEVRGVRVIEIPIDLAANTALHHRLWRDVVAALGG